MITRERLEKELQSLREQEREHAETLLMVRGAIQFCEALHRADVVEIPKVPSANAEA